MSKINKVCLILIVPLVLIIGFLFCLNIEKDKVSADSTLSFVDAIYTTDNLGFSTFGYSNRGVSNFGGLTIRPNYDNTFLSFMVRCGLRVENELGMNGIIGYRFRPVLQIKNEYYYLRMVDGYVIGGSNSNLNGGNNFVTNNYFELLLSNIQNNSLLGFANIPLVLNNYSSNDNNVNSLAYFAFRFDNDNNYSNYEILTDLASFSYSSVEIGSSNNWSYGDAFGSSLNNVNYRFNYVIYRTELGSSFLFAFGSSINVNVSYLWDYRFNYVYPSANLSLPNYQSGYLAGYNDGKSAGYNLGIEASNQYSFFSLISAVIDAPISVFKSLFNFEFLGFNLLSFVTGLLTLIFIVWIIRLIL